MQLAEPLATRAFIMVFAGALLAREGAPEKGLLNSRRLQTIALSLFAAVVVPRQFSDLFVPRMATLAFSTALDLVSFLAIGLGARAVANSRSFACLVAILVVYAALECARDLQVTLVDPRPDMSNFFVFGFAVSKVLVTLTFGYIVLWHHKHGRKRVQ